MNAQNYHRWADTSTEVMGLVGLATFGVPIWMVGTQVFTWLRHGTWPRNPVGNWLIENNIYPWTEWAGVQRILDWLASWPTSFVVFLLGLGFCSVIGWFGEKLRAKGDRMLREERALAGHQ